MPSPADLQDLTLAQVAVLQNDLMTRLQSAASLSDFYASLGLAPDFFESIYALGVADYQAGDYESARLHLTKLLRVQPGEPRFCKAMGTTLQALQQYEAALIHYLDAFQGRPHDVSILFYSAQCLLMLKRQDDAHRVLQALIARPDAQLWHEQARTLLPLSVPHVLFDQAKDEAQQK